MTEIPEASDPLSAVPPDWVPLPDLNKWLIAQFGMNSERVVAELVTQVRKGYIGHKVSFIRTTDLRRSAYAGDVIDPPGFFVGKNGFVCVKDWDDAEMDWPSGTVSGLMQRNGTRERLAVLLYWLDVHRCAGDALRKLSARLDRERELAGNVTSPNPILPQDELVRTWLRGFGIAFHSRGEKPKRDDAIKLCMQHTGVTYRAAEAEWKALPSDWKNPPRKPKP